VNVHLLKAKHQQRAQGSETGEKWMINGARCQRLLKESVGQQILSPGITEFYIGNWMT
jgi:hypothetical protein